jgi:SAM-dependent methyltransferase
MQQDALDNGWDASTEAWVRSMDNGEFNRTKILDPAMLRVCGEVRGRRVLDVGCGEGRFCRMLAERGAETVGLDPTEGLLRVARERQPGGNFVQGMAEFLPFTAAEFDLVVSFVTLVDIEDYQAAIQEMARVLRPGGVLAVANLNSFTSATPRGWERGEDGAKLHWTLDHYMRESWGWAEWAGIRIRNHHRPLSAYMRAFLAAGLVLEHFEEPQPLLTEEEVATDAYAARQQRESLRKPDFVVMRWRKVQAAP